MVPHESQITARLRKLDRKAGITRGLQSFRNIVIFSSMMTWIFLIAVPMLIGLWAQSKVSSAFKRWSQVRAERYARQVEMGLVPADLELPRAPSGRDWSGLTDDEREKIKAATLDLHGIAKYFATAIEAKLREKNT